MRADRAESGVSRINVFQVAQTYAAQHAIDPVLKKQLAAAWANGYEKGLNEGRTQILRETPEAGK